MPRKSAAAVKEQPALFAEPPAPQTAKSVAKLKSLPAVSSGSKLPVQPCVIVLSFQASTMISPPTFSLLAFTRFMASITLIQCWNITMRSTRTILSTIQAA